MDTTKALQWGKASLSILISLRLAAPVTQPVLPLLLFPVLSHASERSAPPLMLANVFDAARVNVADYMVSEKLDGIRAYWTGRELLTRNGNRIHAPAWFTSGWPPLAMDGELWAGRNAFEQVSATIRDHQPDDAAWQLVTFNVFDLPHHPGDFATRTRARHEVVDKLDHQWVRSILHYDVANAAMLDALMNDIVASGGEGLMLHRSAAKYSAGRSDDLLKLKPYRDDEAVVVGYTDGKGKHEGKLGALKVRRDDGVEFLIGTGFTDAERLKPPEIGSYVTYAYQGLTAKGLPRFARYVRQHDRP